MLVSLQSEKEKQLKRLVRKEERKEERRQARRDRKQGSDDQDVDQETYLRSVGFDPAFMKTQRYQFYIHFDKGCYFFLLQFRTGELKPKMIIVNGTNQIIIG